MDSNFQCDGEPTLRVPLPSSQVGEGRLSGRITALIEGQVPESCPFQLSTFQGSLRIVTGATVAETESLIREAIEYHHEGLMADGLPIPPLNSQAEYIDVTA